VLVSQLSCAASSTPSAPAAASPCAAAIGRSDEDYILHRLTVAGSRGRPTFSRAALWAIHHYSRGVPRLINAACDKALLVGYVEGRDHLGWKQVRRGIRALEDGDR
jgi:hypothetical protein